MMLNFNPRSPCGERPGWATGETRPMAISIHAPRAGSDARSQSPVNTPATFQSTLPVRGATTSFLCRPPRVDGFQSTLPVRGATLRAPAWTFSVSISIHAPRAGSDPVFWFSSYPSSLFQSTLPVRGATADSGRSPSAPRYFNPRSPCGERQRRCSKRNRLF